MFQDSEKNSEHRLDPWKSSYRLMGGQGFRTGRVLRRGRTGDRASSARPVPEGSGGAEGRPGQSLADQFEPGLGSALASIGLTISNGRLRFDRAPTAHRAWTWRKGSGAVGASAL
jgi:hypothetical protein